MRGLTIGVPRAIGTEPMPSGERGEGDIDILAWPGQSLSLHPSLLSTSLILAISHSLHSTAEGSERLLEVMSVFPWWK
jgi:hypothetical protein